MNITWVLGLPTGHESGTFLALDLGGTNLRVCKVELHGPSSAVSQKHTLVQEQYKLPSEIKTSTAEELWAYVAEYLEKFMKKMGLLEHYNREKPMPLGFTFSYPAIQYRIDHGILQTWTKGFDIKGVEGEDVAAQLRHAIERKKLPIELICLANDTVGAMVASAYNDPETIIGAIFGTGCNAAYMQTLSKECIPKIDLKDEEWEQLKSDDGSKSTIAINCEYGAFDNAHRVLPRTSFDEQVDAESPRPGEQAFEKLSAGLYLGEIFRLVMVQLADKGLVFKNQDREKLRKPYSIDTGFLSQIEDDESPKFNKTYDLFKETLDLSPSDQEIELSRRLAELIAVRGARLCACGIAAICTKEGIEKGHVAADGSVANKHPKFKRRWAKALGEILNWHQTDEKQKNGGPIKITSAEDGSGVGVAVIAAMTLQRKSQGNTIGMF